MECNLLARLLTQAIPGDIHLMAASYLPGNQVLTLDGSGDFVIVPDLIDLSGYELTIRATGFAVHPFNPRSASNPPGHIVAGWQGLHILSDDGGEGAGECWSQRHGRQVASSVDDLGRGDAQWVPVMLTVSLSSSGMLLIQRFPFSMRPFISGAFNGVSEFMEGQLDEIAIWNDHSPTRKLAMLGISRLMAVKRDFWDCGNLTMEPLKIRHPMDLMESSMEML